MNLLDMIKAIRKEAGNLKYDYFFPMDDAGVPKSDQVFIRN